MSAVAVCKLSEIESGKVRKFTVNGRAVAVVRIDDAVYAIGDRCSHADVSLSDGDVLCDSKELECIKHGSAFSLVTGVPNTLPATQPVPVYEASVVNGEVMISVGEAKGAHLKFAICRFRLVEHKFSMASHSPLTVAKCMQSWVRTALASQRCLPQSWASLVMK